MSDTTTIEPTDQVVCPVCEAPVGEPCRTPSGRRAKNLHPARVEGTLDAQGDTPEAEPQSQGFTDEQVTEALAVANERLEAHKPVPNSKIRILVWELESFRNAT